MNNNRNHIVIPNDPPKGPSFWAGLILLVIPVTAPIGFFMLLWRGKREYTRHQYNNFRHYAAIIGDRTHVSIRELATRLGKSNDTVIRDIQAMIDQNIIDPRAYIDRNALLLYLQGDIVETQFVNHTVNVFVNNPAGAKSAVDSQTPHFVLDPEPEPEVPKPRVDLKKAQESAKPKPAARKSAADSEEFEAKLREIRQLNEEIENEVVSQRIDRIGALTASIFRVVREKPERADEVRKFMNYYLPTTLKLLKSYSLMEKQSYQGENIQASRKKIENVLANLVYAFEQQQDKLFQSEAMDVEADISVLETMMASDGLTEQGKGLRL